MKKAVIYWFVFLAILLFATSCNVQKKSTKTEFEQTKDTNTHTSSETNTKIDSEKFTAEPVDNSKPMQFNDRFFYNTKVIYSTEKTEENKTENTDKSETENTSSEIVEAEKSKQFVFKDIYFLYVFMGLFAFKFLQKQNII